MIKHIWVFKDPKAWRKFNKNQFFFTVGFFPDVEFDKSFCLNDQIDLAAAAADCAEQFVDDISSACEKFNRDIDRSGIGLGYITEFGCRKTEGNDLFSNVVLLTSILKFCEEEGVCQLSLVGFDSVEIEFFRLNSAGINVTSTNVKNRISFYRVKKLLRVLKFFASALLVSICNLFLKEYSHGSSRHLRLTRWPTHLYTDAGEPVDGKLGQLGDANWLVDCLTDGHHQASGLGSFLIARKKFSKFDNTILLDSYLRTSDVLWAIYQFVSLFVPWRRAAACADGLICDLECHPLVKRQLFADFYKTVGLMMFMRKVSYAVKRLMPTRVDYTLFEYPYGRALSYVLHTHRVHAVGYQHGPIGIFKLVHFLAKRETSVPLPNEIVVEDIESEMFYRLCGYTAISVASEVPRLRYLQSLKAKKNAQDILIVAGLHDGPELMQYGISLALASPSLRFKFRPHPRSGKTFSIRSMPANMSFDSAKISEALINAKLVIFSYSSVGLEALRLGISIIEVQIPGVVPQGTLAAYHTEVKGNKLMGGNYRKSSYPMLQS